MMSTQPVMVQLHQMMDGDCLAQMAALRQMLEFGNRYAMLPSDVASVLAERLGSDSARISNPLGVLLDLYADPALRPALHAMATWTRA